MGKIGAIGLVGIALMLFVPCHADLSEDIYHQFRHGIHGRLEKVRDSAQRLKNDVDDALDNARDHEKHSKRQAEHVMNDVQEDAEDAAHDAKHAMEHAAHRAERTTNSWGNWLNGQMKAYSLAKAAQLRRASGRAIPPPRYAYTAGYGYGTHRRYPANY